MDMLSKAWMVFCYKCLDEVVHFCQRRGLDLSKNPRILDIIPDIYEKLRLIIERYSGDYQKLNQIEYFRIYIFSLLENCNRTIVLFKNAKDDILDSKSKVRFRLTRLSFIFLSHLKDLEALFPDNLFDVINFRITKPDAARWWASNFGTRAIVPWKLFESMLLQSFCISDNLLHALQLTIDVTCNHHVSIFEFDVFTRLFQPWNNVVSVWTALVILNPGYKAFMTYDEVGVFLEQYLVCPGPGSYVFRLSCTKFGRWVVGYIDNNLKIRQTVIQYKSLIQFLVDGERNGIFLYPNGDCIYRSHVLHSLLGEISHIHLKVTKEQYQLYLEIGSFFELCKICDENNKNVRLEPCGHLLCEHCLLQLHSFDVSQKCPFCRLEIKDIEAVIIDPFVPNDLTISQQHSFKFNNLNYAQLDVNNSDVED